MIKDHCKNLPDPEFILLNSQGKSFALIKIAQVSKKTLEKTAASYNDHVYKRTDGAAELVKTLDFDVFRQQMIKLREDQAMEIEELNNW